MILKTFETFPRSVASSSTESSRRVLCVRAVIGCLLGSWFSAPRRAPGPKARKPWQAQLAHLTAANARPRCIGSTDPTEDTVLALKCCWEPGQARSSTCRSGRVGRAVGAHQGLQWNPHSESSSEEMQRKARPDEGGGCPKALVLSSSDCTSSTKSSGPAAPPYNMRPTRL